MQQEILSVSAVNSHIQHMMDNDLLLSGLCIRGEISNYKVYPSGHHYFSLKDAGGALKCVMFKSSAFRLRFRPENGMQVLAMGRISVYPRDGAYQLYCTGIMHDGKGDLHIAFEQLKKKLEEQGLFDREHKKPIPKYPRKIVIITSPAGAAIQDMLRILHKRYPIAAVSILPVRVQGAEAPGEIASAIRYANAHHLGDLIITGRGGGSMEDLWAFNEEIVARAVYDSEIPIISAVGHEPDVTICDYVADLRAATPSNGAELAVPEREELLALMQAYNRSMLSSASRQFRGAENKLKILKSSRILRSPEGLFDNKRLYLDNLHRRLTASMDKQTAQKRQKFIGLTASLDAMSPLKVIARGYAVVQNHKGDILRSAKQTAVGEHLSIQLAEGLIRANVTDITELKEEEKHG